MKYPLHFTRICIAIILTLVIGMLPHHHHHGELCWVLSANESHSHKGTAHHKECPSDPCNESTCYLQSMRTFLQAERPDNITPVVLDASLPEIFQLKPAFFTLHHLWITVLCYPPLRNLPEAESLRGPPFC